MFREIEVKIYSVVFSKFLKEYHDCAKLHFPNLVKITQLHLQSSNNLEITGPSAKSFT